MFIIKVVAAVLGFVIGFAFLSVVVLPVSPVLGGIGAAVVLYAIP